jgi:hypothetical protein
MKRKLEDLLLDILTSGILNILRLFFAQWDGHDKNVSILRSAHPLDTPLTWVNTGLCH